MHKIWGVIRICYLGFVISGFSLHFSNFQCFAFMIVRVRRDANLVLLFYPRCSRENECCHYDHNDSVFLLTPTQSVPFPPWNPFPVSQSKVSDLWTGVQTHTRFMVGYAYDSCQLSDLWTAIQTHTRFVGGYWLWLTIGHAFNTCRVTYSGRCETCDVQSNTRLVGGYWLCM